MPAMMTTRQTAAALGVSENRIRRAIKRTGMWWRLTREHSGGSYLFSPHDVIALAEILKVRHLKHLRRTLTPEDA